MDMDISANLAVVVVAGKRGILVLYCLYADTFSLIY